MYSSPPKTNTVSFSKGTESSSSINEICLLPLCIINFTFKILPACKVSCSAVNNTRIPLTRGTPSTLYPIAPSIVENMSVVNVSTRSTFLLFLVPKLKSFNPALNSIIGRVARWL